MPTTTTVAVERLVALSFLVVGLSHLIRPHAWTTWFEQLRARGEAGALDYGMLSLTLGALIVGFHGTQWTGLGAIVTGMGWIQLVKGAVHMCFPAYSLKQMERVPREQAWKIAAAGGMMIPLAGVMLYGSLR